MPRVQIRKNVKYTLMEPIILKEVHVSGIIVPNLKKMSFSNHDLKKYLEFKLQNYMDNVSILECVPIELVHKDWERG